MSKKFISFSKNFKEQYYECELSMRSDINNALKNLADIVQYMHKKELQYTKLNLKLKIGNTHDKLIIWVKPDPRIIVKQIG